MTAILITLIVILIIYVVIGIVAGFFFIVGASIEVVDRTPKMMRFMAFAFCVFAWPWVLSGIGPIMFEGEDDE